MKRLKLLGAILALLALIALVIVYASPYAPVVQPVMDIEEIWAIEDTRAESETPLVTALELSGMPLARDAEANRFYCIIQAVKMVRPGGTVSNVNYLGEGDFVKIPRVEWGVGMGHKKIVGGLTPGGRLKMEKMAALLAMGKLDTSKLVTHVFEGFDKIEEALMLMKDKPADLIKPVVKCR